MPLVPRIVEIKLRPTRHVKTRFAIDKYLKNGFKLTSSTYRNNVDVDILKKYK